MSADGQRWMQETEETLWLKFCREMTKFTFNFGFNAKKKTTKYPDDKWRWMHTHTRWFVAIIFLRSIYARDPRIFFYWHTYESNCIIFFRSRFCLIWNGAHAIWVQNKRMNKEKENASSHWWNDPVETLIAFILDFFFPHSPSIAASSCRTTKKKRRKKWIQNDCSASRQLGSLKL